MIGKQALVPLALLALAAPSRASEAPVAPPELTGWSQSHPDAAAALEQWIRQYPNAAHRLFVWDRQHPRRAQTFVEWAAASAGQGLDAFDQGHPDWPVVGDVFRPFRPAVEGLVAWAQAHPRAAKDLMVKPRGLACVGFHLFRSDWEPEIAPAGDTAATAAPAPRSQVTP